MKDDRRRGREKLQKELKDEKSVHSMKLRKRNAEEARVTNSGTKQGTRGRRGAHFQWKAFSGERGPVVG